MTKQERLDNIEERLELLEARFKVHAFEETVGAAKLVDLLVSNGMVASQAAVAVNASITKAHAEAEDGVVPTPEANVEEDEDFSNLDPKDFGDTILVHLDPKAFGETEVISVVEPVGEADISVVEVDND